MAAEETYHLAFNMPGDIEKRRFKCDAIDLVDACEQLLQAYPGANLLDGAVHPKEAR